MNSKKIISSVSLTTAILATGIITQLVSNMMLSIFHLNCKPN